MATSSFNYHTKKVEELSAHEKELLEKAKEALQFAHAPYSNFKVACAVRLSNETIITGTNQENAAYPAGMCAERVALFAARGSANADITQILVIAKNGRDQWADAFSCGNCRQVMMEYANLQKESISILMGTKNEELIKVSDVRDLMPFHFNSDNLG